MNGSISLLRVDECKPVIPRVVGVGVAGRLVRRIMTHKEAATRIKAATPPIAIPIMTPVEIRCPRLGDLVGVPCGFTDWSGVPGDGVLVPSGPLVGLEREVLPEMGTSVPLVEFSGFAITVSELRRREDAQQRNVRHSYGQKVTV
jgi:hypothetical protein